MNTGKQKKALRRAETLKSRITDYLEARKNIKKGREIRSAIEARQKTIIDALGASREAWNDYKWQLENRISTIEVLKKFLPLSRIE